MKDGTGGREGRDERSVGPGSVDEIYEESV